MDPVAMRAPLPAQGERSQDDLAGDPVRDQRAVLSFSDRSRPIDIRPVRWTPDGGYEWSVWQPLPSRVADDRGNSLALHRLLEHEFRFESCSEGRPTDCSPVESRCAPARRDGSGNGCSGPAAWPWDFPAEDSQAQSPEERSVGRQVLWFFASVTAVEIAVVGLAYWLIHSLTR
jgi:hypothetical protein